MLAEEQLVAAARSNSQAFEKTVEASADILLDAPTATEDAKGLWADAETTGINGNVKFFTDPNNLRNFEKLTEQIQAAYVELGLLSAKTALAKANWNYQVLGAGLKTAGALPTPTLNAEKVAKSITAKAATGTLDNDTLLSFEINFKANQRDFPVAVYQQQFNKAVELAATYPGAVITIEGHADPRNYVKSQILGRGAAIQNRIKQSARTLSVQRAVAVRDAIIDMAAKQGVSLVKAQFVAVGLGVTQPKKPIPNTRESWNATSKPEWMEIVTANRRVVFKLVNVEAESDNFGEKL